jgi:hypothetical protein
VGVAAEVRCRECCRGALHWGSAEEHGRGALKETKQMSAKSSATEGRCRGMLQRGAAEGSCRSAKSDSEGRCGGMLHRGAADGLCDVLLQWG